MNRFVLVGWVLLIFTVGFWIGAVVAANRWQQAWIEENRIRDEQLQDLNRVPPPPIWWWQDRNGNMIRGKGEPPSA